MIRTPTILIRGWFDGLNIGYSMMRYWMIRETNTYIRDSITVCFTRAATSLWVGGTFPPGYGPFYLKALHTNHNQLGIGNSWSMTWRRGDPLEIVKSIECKTECPALIPSLGNPTWLSDSPLLNSRGESKGSQSGSIMDAITNDPCSASI